MNAVLSSLLSVSFLVMDTSAISIVSTQPPPGTIIPEGSNLTISCSSSVPWFFCLFHSPMGDKQCGIQESEVSSVCSSDTLLSLSGVSSTCSLDIARVTRDMHGGWMCLLNEIEQFDSVKTIVRVEVGVPAKVGWITHTQEGLLHLVEGEEKEIVCGATDGYPHADFAWTSYSSEDRTLQTRNARMFNQHEDEFPDDSPSSLITNRTGKATYSLVPGSHLYSGSQSLLYTGSLSDNGTIILCRVQQSAADGAVLYTSTVQLQLMVRELVVSQSTAMEERIGIISGIILAIIFIILIFILIAFLLTRRLKQNGKYSSLPSKSHEQLLTPIWIPGKVSGVQVSSARQFVQEYREDDDVQGLSEYSKVMTHNTLDPRCEHYKHGSMLPEHLLNTSLDSESGDSYEVSSRNQSCGATLSRPTTRTTKTISDTSSSSCSSTADKSAMREYQIESYISFQSELSDHAREAIEHVDSPDDTIASDKIFSDPGDVTTYSDNCDSLSRMHETHFGDSLSDIPRTVIHSPSDIPRTVIHSPSAISRTVISSSPLKSHAPTVVPMKGKTIFDCELGCFITVEEYQRRQRVKQSP